MSEPKEKPARGAAHWMAVARSSDADDVREHILTGFKSGKPFTPYTPTIAIPSPVTRVLDFGCGLGRSFAFLKTIARHITGFDLPPMIARCRELATEGVDVLSDDWPSVAAGRYDLVYTALVLQHVEPPACRAYLLDFARIAPRVYLLTRGSSDFETSVLDAIAETELFDVGECVEVDHDPDTHQLRVLGRTSFDALRRSEAAGHYEMLLETR